jgi:DNA mismatch endonuclease (patch repair protein)
MDRLSTEARSRLMQAVKSKNTKPELTVRSLLHRMGYRFRLHGRVLPGTPDIVFTARRVAVFVHGCFWHGHGCRIGRPSKSRVEYWGPKIDANRDRDARKHAELETAGWRVLVVWQCDLKDLDALEAKLRNFLGPPSISDR